MNEPAEMAARKIMADEPFDTNKNYTRIYNFRGVPLIKPSSLSAADG